METINIPLSANGANPVVVMVNGAKYIIPRGQNVSVPGGVADVVRGMLDWPEADIPVNNDRILPIVSASDNGKILRVVDGKWAVSDETVELPAVTTTDNGKILAVSSGTWSKADETKELPAVTGDDDDKVLTVVSGAWAAADLPADDTET